jgi:hypothetical protein
VPQIVPSNGKLESVDAQKNDVMAKKFAEAVKKAKETPLADRPLRDLDLDYALQLPAKK